MRRHRVGWVIGILSGWALAVSSTGCHGPSRQKVLSLFFDGVSQTPPPPTRRLRRDLLREIDALTQQLAKAQDARAQRREAAGPAAAGDGEPARPIERAKTWEHASSLLPTTEGVVDWSHAVANGVITPRTGIAPNAPPLPELPLDVEMAPTEDPAYRVVFPHQPHTAWLSCANCHPGLYRMKAGSSVVTMDRINEGESCGRCHGKVAFAPDACTRCHRALGGS